MWIRRFGLNRVEIWQGNCFMEIHCSAAISWRLRRYSVRKSSGRRAGSDGVRHAHCPAKSYFFPATREAGLVQIANALSDGRINPQKSSCVYRWVPDQNRRMTITGQTTFPELRWLEARVGDPGPWAETQDGLTSSPEAQCRSCADTRPSVRSGRIHEQK